MVVYIGLYRHIFFKNRPRFIHEIIHFTNALVNWYGDMGAVALRRGRTRSEVVLAGSVGAGGVP